MILSFSSLSLFLKCGQKFYYKYIEKIPEIGNEYRTIGSAFHRSYGEGFKEKLQTGQIDLPALLDKTEAIAKQEREINLLDKVIEPMIIDTSVKTVKTYYPVTDTVIPEEVETRIEFNNFDRDIKLVGYIDLIDKEHNIIEYKVKKRKPTQLDNLQTSVYSFLYSAKFKSVPDIYLDYVILTKNMENVRYYAKKNQEDIKRMLETAKKVIKAINMGIFLPAPEGAWWCSKDYCAYWNNCY